jgi:hypothetical protein
MSASPEVCQRFELEAKTISLALSHLRALTGILNPGNVMLTKSGVTFLDFGQSRNKTGTGSGDSGPKDFLFLSRTIRKSSW